MQIFRILSAWIFSVEDKNSRRVDVRSEREKERPEIVTSSLSASSLSSLLLLSLPPLFCRGNRWTFTQQRSAFRCAAIIAYCERKLSLGQSFQTAAGRYNKRRSLARKWRWLFNAVASSVANHDAFLRSYATRDLSYFISPIVCQIFSKAFVQRLDVAQICATHDVAD